MFQANEHDFSIYFHRIFRRFCVLILNLLYIHIYICVHGLRSSDDGQSRMGTKVGCKAFKK